MSERRGPDPDELYVGYLPETPPVIARFVRRTVWLLGAALLVAAVALVAIMAPFDPGFFEFGSPRTLVGTIDEEPYPTLVVDAPGSGEPTRLLLVDLGKHGAGERVTGLDGAAVEATGTLAARPDLAVFELSADPERLPTPIVERASRVPTVERVTLPGEIVDSKCFAGVMKPGRDKVHRRCASLCIRGGIPPAFVTPAEDGGVEVYVLVDAEGRAVGDRILEWVGEPVEVSGLLEPRGDQTLLRADLASLRRLERDEPAD